MQLVVLKGVMGFGGMQAAIQTRLGSHTPSARRACSLETTDDPVPVFVVAVAVGWVNAVQLRLDSGVYRPQPLVIARCVHVPLDRLSRLSRVILPPPLFRDSRAIVINSRLHPA